MALNSQVMTVFCTCPDTGVAERLASGIVERRLAACVNVLPAVRSIYRWGGEVHNDGEVLMMVKTTRSAYPALESWLVKNHPYDVPEVLALGIEAGTENYLEWVEHETEGHQSA